MGFGDSMKRWSGELIEKRHIEQAAVLWDKGKRPSGFGKSIRYDVYINDKPYPPKAICALAYWLAAKEKLAAVDFKGAGDGYWHQILKNHFPVKYKNPAVGEQAEIDKIRHLSDKELRELAERHATKKPLKESRVVVTYERNAYVRLARLRKANGKCGHCKEKAPFKKMRNNEPYLEVHHKIPLSKGGADSFENTIALCPNCHAKVHDRLGFYPGDE